VILCRLKADKMTTIRIAEIELPEFGIAEERPSLAPGIYAARMADLERRMKADGLSTLIVYADREHFANIAYLTEFEPRFEEALLIVSPGRRPAIVTGPENVSWPGRGTPPLDVDMVLYPPFGLLGQDRRHTPPLADLFSGHGVKAGDLIGAVGWKFFSQYESRSPDQWVDIPSYIADTLRLLVGATGRVVNATALLMSASSGLRASNEVEQIAQFEFSACQTSEAIKRVVFHMRPGMREFDIARMMQPIGLPLSCHTMFSSGQRAYFGLNSPSDRVVQRGDPYTAALGVWGALNCRAGWIAEQEGELPAQVHDYVERLAIPYFACVAEWYEMIGIGVSGGTIDALVKRHLGDPFFGVGLNPGHLLHLDEWLNSPIYPGSTESLASGQLIQVDIIPATGTAYFTSNIEDGIALLDARGRAQFAERFPAAWSRIDHRRAFMADTIGVNLKPEVLPLSNIPAYLPPFALSPKHVFVRN
jgi:hypothetical protein